MSDAERVGVKSDWGECGVRTGLGEGGGGRKQEEVSGRGGGRDAIDAS